MNPLVFVHHGASLYLPYTLRMLAFSNPQRPIVFLGNESNHSLVSPYANFVNFRELSPSPERLHFEKIFRPIVGKEHGKQGWVKFVFLRFFLLYEYWLTSPSDHLWSFDSDTFVLEDLSPLEQVLHDYDCSEQCNGMCMSGFIKHPSVLQSFLKTILDLYESPAFLATEVARLQEQPTHAFTEMRAYQVWKEQNSPKTFHLANVQDGTVCDDCLCQEHGMEMYSKEEADRQCKKQCKKLYLHPSGHLYCHKQDSAEFLLLRTLNMSWLPLHVFSKVFKARTIVSQPGVSQPLAGPLYPKREDLRILTLQAGLRDALAFHYHNFLRAFCQKNAWP